MSASTDITFSSKPLVLRDCLLIDRVIKLDMEALVELIVRRSEPPVAESVVHEIPESELVPLMGRLRASIDAARTTDRMLRGVWTGAIP